MSLIKWTPLYEPFFDLERAFDSFGSAQAFAPAVDIYEKDNNLIADVALSGIDPKNVTINIEDNILNIEGHTESKSEIDEKQYYRKEVRSGSFHRVIALPTAVDGSRASADYEKGILTVTMPKKEEAKSKPITINVKKA